MSKKWEESIWVSAEAFSILHGDEVAINEMVNHHLREFNKQAKSELITHHEICGEWFAVRSSLNDEKIRVVSPCYGW